ncbi:MAG: hypothetical protein A4E53_00643 [Pelotomaculum sp. PtaB.Bin104]|nr:MAG: hypothetical protein A4E53_00643 [Pelotomaculum sp. PtaB.Bin104]
MGTPIPCREREQKSVGSGPVVSYKLQPEEVKARFRTKPDRDFNGVLSYNSVRRAMRRSVDQVGAADLLGIKLEDLEQYIKRYKIKPCYGPKVGGRRKMQTVTDEITGENAVLAENANVSAGQAEPGGVQTTQPPEAPPRNRREKICELLTKEKFYEYKKQGLSNEKILEQIGLTHSWQDALSLVSRQEWGFDGRQFKVMLPTADDAGQPEPEAGKAEPAEKPIPAGHMTITELVQLREELIEDLDDITRIMGSIGVSPRIDKLLGYYRDTFQYTLDKIDHVFSITKIAI